MTINKLLCPPGDGVYTVHTAKEYKDSLQKKLYTNTNDVKNAWENSLNSPSNNVAILGVPSDTGGGILRGANWGPLFIREYLYKNYPDINVFELGDVRVIPHLLHDKYLNNETIRSCREALYDSQDIELPVSPLSIAEAALDIFYKQHPKTKVIGLGGDHSVSYPLCMSYIKSRQNENVGILHFDAHTDLLTSRLGIDICFGSWTSHIVPHLKSTQSLVQVGIRSTGKPKEHWENEFGIKQIWAKDVRELSAKNVATNIVEHFKKQNITELYITFDIDCLDASIASATGTPEDNGLNLEEATMIINLCAKEFNVTGADIVEVAPFTNSKLNNQGEPNKTLSSAASICNSLISALQHV